jgi:DNA helicase-2/ATP-dependent DNA helicase PcrA
LAGLNEAQRYAVSLGKGPILVIAGAGSGKTRTLVHRLAWLIARGARPESVLLLTFTRRAAAEMLERARRINPDCARVTGGTFHSLGHRLLRSHGGLIGLPPNFTIIDPADCESIIKGVVEEMHLRQAHDRFPKARTLADFISRSRNLEVKLEKLVEERAEHLLEYADAMAKAAQGYTEAKREQGLVDYDDLLFLTEELLKDNRELARSLGQRWQHLLVDEYQDTNAVQARLLKLLAGEKANMMVVGDDAQSIYAFRGARYRNILEFPQMFPGTRVVKLEQNYRSTQPILDLGNAVIAQALERFEKNLFTELGGGKLPRLVRPRDERGQSRQVVELIQDLMAKDSSPEEIAVLFRAGRDSFDLEMEMTAARIPFVKWGGMKFLEAAHVKDVLCHLRVMANPADFLSWQRILMLAPKVGPKTARQIVAHLVHGVEPPQYISRLRSAPQTQRNPALADLADLLESLDQPGMASLQMVEQVLKYYEPICTLLYEDHPRRLRDLAELPALARGYETVAEFMSEVVLEPPIARQEELTGPRVTLSTVHSAKGLEWDQVIILWLGEGRFPSGASYENPEALEEELRLLYVAATRARRGLTLFSPQEYYLRGQGVTRVKLSRFVDNLPSHLLGEESLGPVFPVESPAAAAPASRGGRDMKKPFPAGSLVRHARFGRGKVMGYQGEKKILVHFAKYGLKILRLDMAQLEADG